MLRALIGNLFAQRKKQAEAWVLCRGAYTAGDLMNDSQV
jgi:hypothetical protein